MKINGLLFLVVVLGMFMLPVAFSAELPAECKKGTSGYNLDSCVSTVCEETTDDTLASLYAKTCIISKIEQIANLITIIAGIIAVIAIVITGIMMAMSDDPESRNKLKDKLKYIIFGLVLIVLARMIVQFIVGM